MSLRDWTRGDLVRAARGLKRRPAFAAAALSTLALGIGANAAMFSVVSAVLLAPLPYREPERRVMVWSRWTGFDKTWVSEAEVADYRRSCPSLAQVAAWSSGQANLTGDGDAVRVGMAAVSANTFDTLGARLLLGRSFTDEEDRPGGEPVVMVGYRLWQSRFGGDAGVVGRSLLVDGQSRRVVGVMPAGFALPTDFGEDAAAPTELWVPLQMDLATSERGNHGLYAAAELRPGRTAVQATEELRTLTRSLTREGLYPETMAFTAFAVPVADEIFGSTKTALFLLLGAVGFLLLIACANVANLLLVRAEGRQREVALRTALGAGRMRLAAELLAEVVVLAIPGALLGLTLAAAGLRLLATFSSAGIPRVETARLDSTVLAFTAGITLLAAFLFGLAPLFRGFRVSLAETLREAGPSASMGIRRSRTRGLLIVTEMALCVVLLLGAGLLVRSLAALGRVDLGFVPQGVLTARLAVSPAADEAPDRTVAFYRQVLERVRALPGVRHAGLVRSLPLGAQIGDWGLDIDGFVETPERGAKGDWQVASDGALEALGERLVSGRSFTDRDTADTEQVGLVNETLARTYWPGQDPMGRRFRMGSNAARPWVTVVGVVADERHNGVTAPIKEKFYRPHAQFHRSTGFAPSAMTLVVKAEGDLRALAPALRAAVREVDPAVPVSAVRLMSDVVKASLATPRLAGFLLALFAGVALVLSAVGIYGVLAHLVSQRTQEIGIRVAIGAAPGAVRRLILGHGLRLSLLGVGLGSVLALALTRGLRSLLHGVTAHDPLTFVAVPLLLMVVALVASYVPARRATLVDPIAALRTE